MKVTRKLLIPTLIFITIMFLGFITINTLNTRADIEASEEQNLAEKLETFQERLESRESFAVGLALEVANNPEIQAAFAAGDRERLTELTLPSYLLIDEQFDIPQHQFHLPPATSFLRLHTLDRYGDDLSSFRFTVLTANAEERPVSGPEIGRAGLGIRGVAPVSYENEHIGTVEFGLNIDQTLLNALKEQMNADLQLMLLKEPAEEVATFAGATEDVQGPSDDLILQASTLEEPIFGEATIYPDVLEGTPAISRISVDDLQYAIISAPVYDFSGKVIGVIEIFNDRTAVVANQRQNVATAVVAAVVTITLGGVGLALIMTRMLSPIGKLTEAAAAISEGDLNRIVGVDTNDEIGLLATAFNNMTVQLKSFIGSLEDRVAARTSDLNLAAEIGRQVSQVRDLHELLPQAVQLVLEQFGLYQTQIYLVDEADKWLVLEASTGHAGTQLLEAGHALPIDEKSLNGTAVITKQAVLVADTAENPTFRPHPMLPDTRSEMVVPLVVGDKVVGVLDLQSDKPNALAEENLPAFETLAGQLAVAIQNAALLNERQQAEAEIREREFLMRTIIDSTPDWIFVKDTDHRYLMVNQGYADSFHMTPDDFLGKNDLDIGFPEEIVKGDPEKGIRGFWADDREIMERGEVKIIDEEPAVVDGEQRWLNTIKAPLKDDDGTVTGIVGFVHDITQRKQFEKELEEAHARTQEILESINVPLVVSRISDGIVAYVNKPLAEMIRVPREELIGQITPDFYHNPADREAYLKGLREQGQVSNFDLLLKRGDGDLVWTLVSGRVINFQGELAIISSLIDITDRREAEATIARRATELETVANVSAVAATILEPEELLQQVVDLTKERFELYHAHLYLMGENRTRLVLANGAGDIGHKMVTEGRQIALTQEQSLVARAARTRQGVVINNVQAEPGFLPHPLLPNTQSELAVPLIAGNEVLGVLDIQADEVDYFTPEEVNVFTTLASQIAVAVQNARRHDEAQRALDELTRLQRIMVREGWQDYLTEQERPFSGYAFDTKGAKPIENMKKADGTPGETKSGAEGSYAETAFPIAVRGEMIGKIALRNPDGRAIPERKQSLIETVSRQVSEALERARLTAQTQKALAETAEQARRRAVLNLTSEQLNRADTLEDIFNIIAENTAQILPSDRVSLAILDDTQENFTVMSLAGAGENVPVQVEQPLAGSFIEKAIKSGDILVTLDAEPSEIGIRSSMIVPLVTGTGTIGTLNVGSKAAQAYDDGDQSLALQIASLISSIIENKRLLTETEERAKELMLINRVVAEVSSSLDVERSLQIVAEELAKAIDVDAVGIALMNPDKTSLTITAEYYDSETSGSTLGYQIPIEGNPSTQKVLNTRQTVVIEDAQHNPLTEPVHEGMRMRGLNTLYLIPMFAGNEILGTVGIDILEKGRVLSLQQLRLAETLIFQAATAVQNARLFNEAEERAEELTLINAVSEMASSHLELSSLFESVGQLLCGTFAAESLYFALYDKKAEMISFPYFFSHEDGVMDVAPRTFEQGGYTGQIIASRESLLRIVETESPAEDMLAEGAQIIGSGRDTDCYLGTPMIVGNEVIGVVGLSSYRETRTYNEQDQRLLETLADTIGVAVQNIRQFQAAQRQAEREALVNAISQKIQTAPTVEHALQTAVAELGQALKLKKAIVSLSTKQQSSL